MSPPLPVSPSPLATAAPVPIPRSTRPEKGVQVDIFDPRQRIQVATPTRGSVTETYHTCLRALEHSPCTRYRRPDGTVELDTIFASRLTCIGDSHVDRARNVIANIFVEQNQTDWLLWIDDDIEFFPPHIARIFQHAMNGYKFVAGHYAMKCLRPTFVANVKPGAKPDLDETGLIEVTDAGTGFLLLHRDVFLALQTHPRVIPYGCAPNTPTPGAKHYPYFQSGTYGPTDDKTGLQNWLSEDWMLCRMWQELGGKVMADINIKLRHVGTQIFPPTIPELVDPVCDLIERGHPAMEKILPRLRQVVETYKPADARLYAPLPKAA